MDENRFNRAFDLYVQNRASIDAWKEAEAAEKEAWEAFDVARRSGTVTSAYESAWEGLTRAQKNRREAHDLVQHLLYSVLVFTVHPELTNEVSDMDEFATLAEAEACLANPAGHFHEVNLLERHYIQLDGPNVSRLIVPANPLKQRRDDSWRREAAMEAGMLGGCEAYNEVMGY